MAARKLLCVTTSLGAVPVMMSRVYAAEEKKLIKASELPFYGNPQERTVEIVEDESTAYTSTISQIREGTWKICDSLQDTSDMLQNKYGIAKAHTSDLVNYIQSDPGSIPRAAVITVAGLGGIVAGYKRGVLRKGFYAALGMTAAGALCYPNQAYDMSEQAYIKTKDKAMELWDQKPSIRNKKNKEKSPEKVETAKEEKPLDKSLVDMGQSKPEDKDMYSSRS